MTEENQQNFAVETDDPDVTLVAPRFDEAAAETARPVVPLPESDLHDRLTVGPAPAYAQSPVRRSWVIGLVLVSALVGSMLGGIGLRLYQKRQRVAAQTVAPVQTTPAPVETAPAPVEVSAATTTQENATETVAAPTAKVQPPVIVEETEATTPVPTAEKVSRASEARKSESEETKRRVEEASDDRRKSEDNDERRGERKKGKRGDGGDDNDDEARARRVGVITARQSDAPRRSERIRDDYDEYRPRRERPRSEPQSRDRVRAIFEGQPPR